MSTTKTENKEKARQVPEAIDEDNLDLIDEIFADDYVGRNPAVPEPYHGPEGVKEFTSIFRSAFSDLEYTVEDVIAEGDKVVRRDRATGTHDGEFMGIEPTGKKVEIQGIVILRVEDGKFVESWSQFDVLGLMQQLGVAKPSVDSPEEAVQTPTTTPSPSRSEDAIHDLTERFHGEVILPEDENYDDARAVWNGMIDKYPALIARCTGVSDVTTAVDFAREHDLRVAVRGGGHNVAGTAVCDDGIVIDLSEMDGVVVDPDEQTARAQAGATWADVDRETQYFGLVTPGGIVSMTGIAGLTLGGGYSHLRRKYGLTSDNLRSVNIVTADGEFLTASEEQHEDLFWALRGGGGNFGVVTSFEYELHELGPEVMHAGTMYPIETAPSVLRQWRAFVDDAPDEITSDAAFWSVPEHDLFPEDLHGRPVVITAGVYAGPVEDGKEALQPLREFESPVLDLSGVDPYTHVQQQFDPFFQEGLRGYWKSRYLDDLDDQTIETIVEYASDRPSPRTIVPIRARGGKLNRIDPSATAFRNRDSPFQLSIDATWTRPGDDEQCIEWTREFWDVMEPYSSDQMYFNFASGDEGDEIIRTTFGENYSRLVEVKNRYDPDNLFRVNTNIEPTN